MQLVTNSYSQQKVKQFTDNALE